MTRLRAARSTGNQSPSGQSVFDKLPNNKTDVAVPARQFRLKQKAQQTSRGDLPDDRPPSASMLIPILMRQQGERFQTRVKFLHTRSYWAQLVSGCSADSFIGNARTFHATTLDALPMVIALLDRKTPYNTPKARFHPACREYGNLLPLWA